MMEEGLKAGIMVALGTGGLFAIITAFEGTISRAIGPINASLMEHFITGMIAIVFLGVIIKRGDIDLHAVKANLLLVASAGVLVLVAVAGVAYMIPKLGVALGTFTLVFGQLSVAVLIDTFGWLGYEKVPLTPLRVIGILFMIAGIYFILPKSSVN